MNSPKTLKNSSNTGSITLTEDQAKALNSIYEFLLSDEPMMVLTGYAGTGKSTLVKTLLEDLESFKNSIDIITRNNKIPSTVTLTATTHKAVNNLSQITGRKVKTIHKVLDLRVQSDYRTNQSKLIGGPDYDTLSDTFLIVDEASYIDSFLLSQLVKITLSDRCENLKVLLIGDPAQLTPIKTSVAPAFNCNIPTVSLTKVIRQAEGNPIIELATLFREAVITGEFFSFKPDNVHVMHVDRKEFNRLIEAEFNRPNWHYDDSRILAWTNKTVQSFNKYVEELRTGSSEISAGDYVINNEFKVINDKHYLSTDEMLKVLEVLPTSKHGIQGNKYKVSNGIDTVIVFMPNDSNEANRLYLKYRKSKDIRENTIAWTIFNTWVDLRQPYASTVHKSQGSTYRTVFIDLDDIKKCRNGNQLARMLYVAVSRASQYVVITGDTA